MTVVTVQHYSVSGVSVSRDEAIGYVSLGDLRDNSFCIAISDLQAVHLTEALNRIYSPALRAKIKEPSPATRKAVEDALAGEKRPLDRLASKAKEWLEALGD